MAGVFSFFSSYVIPSEMPALTTSFKVASLVTLLLKVKVAQSCLSLCNPMDYTVHETLQARILEWVAFPFFRGSSQPRNQTGVSCNIGGWILLPTEI